MDIQTPNDITHFSLGTMQPFTDGVICDNDLIEGGYAKTETCKKMCSTDPSCTFASIDPDIRYCARYNGTTCKIKTKRRNYVLMKTGLYTSLKLDIFKGPFKRILRMTGQEGEIIMSD